jgi:hypothetical protein
MAATALFEYTVIVYENYQCERKKYILYNVLFEEGVLIIFVSNIIDDWIISFCQKEIRNFCDS